MYCFLPTVAKKKNRPPNKIKRN
jgi:hypothetical protein